tara:strand:- start:3636 stop:3770 length:135 start_codon:yes stop_codon:yes gene_type:complete
MIRQDFEYKPRKGGKKTRQGTGRNSKFGIKGSKKYYRKKPRGQG